MKMDDKKKERLLDKIKGYGHIDADIVMKRVLRIIRRAGEEVWSAIKAALRAGQAFFLGLHEDISEVLFKLSRRIGHFARSSGLSEFTLKSALSGLFSRVHAFIVKHRRGFALSCSLLVIALACAYLLLNYTLGINVYSDGKLVAKAPDKETFETYVSDFEERFSSETGLDFESEHKFDYSFAFLRKGDESDFSQLDGYLISGDVSKMYVLKVDGEAVGANTDWAALEAMLDGIKAKYASNTQGESVTFDESVEVEEQYTPLSSYKSIDMLSQILTVPHKSSVTYTVRHGDTIVSISSGLGMSLETFEKYNPEITPAVIRAGTVLELVKSEPLLSVRVVKTVMMHEPVAFETVTHIDSEKYVDEIEELVSGRDGEKLVTKRVTTLNGVVVQAVELDNEVIEEPQDLVIIQGMKPLPTVGTGTFHMPVSGYISSRYGVRGAGTHSGLDIAAPAGEPIYACDNGIVEFVGGNGVYGLMVLIDHQNGYKTLYAHMSKAVVSEGNRIKQDEKIGEVGATGNATGNHLHIEIRKDGATLNPELYLE